VMGNKYRPVFVSHRLGCYDYVTPIQWVYIFNLLFLLKPFYFFHLAHQLLKTLFNVGLNKTSAISNGVLVFG